MPPQLQILHHRCPYTSKPTTGKLIVRPITASVSERPSITPPPPPAKATLVPPPTKLPVKEVPGDYGLPFFGAISDRNDFFYNQGKEDFFKSRIQKYQSTVFRTNMPPGPFISSKPKVIVLGDAKSFPVLFDLSKVEKKDLFTGTFMPSVELTGGYRTLSFLDPSEPKHSKLKNLIFFQLSSSRDRVIPEFNLSYNELFDSLEKDLASKGKAPFNDANEQAAFNFLGRAFYGANPTESKLGSDGPTIINKWVLFHLHGLLTLGLPKAIENPLIHTLPLPPFLIKKDYQKLYEFIYANSTSVLDEAQRLGIDRDEAAHNLLFATCFNTFGGLKILFPSMLKWIGRAGVKLHTQLAEEIRSVLKSNGGNVTMKALESMTLTKSVVYEALRINPPVTSQYGRAKRDFVLESHNAAFKIKEGEMLYGYQPLATRDPKVFDRAEEFVAERFVGEEGEKLLKYVVWSNGPETESPSVQNKQCAGKDFGVLVSRLLVAEFFRRYDSFDVEVGKSALGDSVTITSLKRASF